MANGLYCRRCGHCEAAHDDPGVGENVCVAYEPTKREIELSSFNKWWLSLSNDERRALKAK